MSDNEENAGINKGDVEDGEEQKQREVNEEYTDDVEELEEEIYMHKQDGYYVEEVEEDKDREVHEEDKNEIGEGEEQKEVNNED